jgi:hypothetical protein
MSNEVIYPEPAFPPSGFMYNEYYLYADKVWEVIPSGVSFYTLAHPNIQNSPVVVTSSGYEVGLDDPWAKTEGVGKWTKVGFGSFTTNPSGAFDTAKKEFALQPDASGKLLFNQMLTESLLVEYEGGDTSYYTMTSLDYNPMRNEVGGGFVHFSKLSDPRSLFLTASQGSILADGFQGCELTATLFDKNFDRVPEKNITFEMMGLTNGNWAELGHLIPHNGTVLSLDSSGVACRTQETTNGRGEARTKWISHKGKMGTQYIKAYYSEASGIYDITSFVQFYWSTGPFILDISLLDSLDYLVGDRYTYTP